VNGPDRKHGVWARATRPEGRAEGRGNARKRALGLWDRNRVLRGFHDGSQLAAARRFTGVRLPPASARPSGRVGEERPSTSHHVPRASSGCVAVPAIRQLSSHAGLPAFAGMHLGPAFRPGCTGRAHAIPHSVSFPHRFTGVPLRASRPGLQAGYGRHHVIPHSVSCPRRFTGVRLRASRPGLQAGLGCGSPHGVGTLRPGLKAGPKVGETPVNGR